MAILATLGIVLVGFGGCLVIVLCAAGVIGWRRARTDGTWRRRLSANSSLENSSPSVSSSTRPIWVLVWM